VPRKSFIEAEKINRLKRENEERRQKERMEIVNMRAKYFYIINIFRLQNPEKLTRTLQKFFLK